MHTRNHSTNSRIMRTKPIFRANNPLSVIYFVGNLSTSKVTHIFISRGMNSGFSVQQLCVQTAFRSIMEWNMRLPFETYGEDYILIVSCTINIALLLLLVCGWVRSLFHCFFFAIFFFWKLENNQTELLAMAWYDDVMCECVPNIVHTIYNKYDWNLSSFWIAMDLCLSSVLWWPPSICTFSHNVRNMFVNFIVFDGSLFEIFETA